MNCQGKKLSRILVLFIAAILAVFVFAGCNSSDSIKITFDTDGGTFVKGLQASSGAELSDKRPNEPRKDGFVFAGWFLDPEKTVPFNFDELPSEDITLYASWEVRTVTVTFKAKLATESEYSIITRTLNYGTAVADLPEVPQRTGFSGVWVYNEGALSNVRSNITILAEYSPAIFTMSFVTNPAEPPLTASGYMGQPYQKPEDPEREDYVFGGWYTDTSYTAPYMFPSVMPSRNITLYAWWVRENELSDYFIYETANFGGFNNNVIRITGTTRVANFKTNIIIPKQIEGLEVKYVGFDDISGGTPDDYYVFNSDYLVAVRIPNTVEYIGKYAFAKASRLSRIVFEEQSTLKYIYDYAFLDCADIEDVSLPKSVETLGDYAFALCDIPENVIPQLSAIRLEPDSNLSYLGRGVFFGTTQLNSFTVPKALHTIDYLSFENCGIASFQTEQGHTTLSALEGVLFSHDNVELLFYPNQGGRYLGTDVNGNQLYEYTIPQTTRKIGMNAFRNNNKLTNITVSAVVNEIYEYAFANMSKLRNLTFVTNSQLQIINAYAFADCDKVEVLGLPTSLKEIREGAFRADKKTAMGIREISFPDGLLSIGPSAFESCSALITAGIPFTVQSIGARAFYGCGQMTLSFNTSNSLLTDIGEYAFYKCYNIKMLTLPPSLLRIGDYAFSNSPGASFNMQLTSVTIENDYNGNRHLQRIGKGVFENCIYLEQFNVSESVSYIGERAFYNCRAVRVQFNALNTALLEIQPYTFYGCTTISNITIPRTVTRVGEYAFFGCSSLGTVQAGSATSPSSITTIGRSAFEGCARLVSSEVNLNQSILFPNTVNVGQRAFYGCAALTNIRIVDSLISLGKEAFAECTALTTIKYGTNPQIETLPADLFKGCSALQTFRFPNSVTALDGNPFSSCGALRGFTIDVDNPTYEIVSNVDFNVLYRKIGARTIELFPSGVATNYEVPADVEKIGPYAFYSSRIIRLTFAASAAALEVAEYAFAESKYLTQVIISPRVNAVGGHAFHNCTALNSLTLNEDAGGVLSIGAFAFYNSIITVLTVPERVDSIGEEAFGGCYRLAQVSFTQSAGAVQALRIGKNAFRECTKITTLTLPARLAYIDDGAFSWCVGLQSLSFSPGDEELVFGSFVFDNCHLLSSVTLPARLTAMGSNIFSNCANLEYAAIEEQDGAVFSPFGLELGEAAFQNAINLRTLIIPGHITRLGNYAFYNCDNIRTMTFTDSPFDLAIGAYAFSECESIADFELPARVTYIDSHAFYRSRLGGAALKMIKDGGMVAAYRPGLTFADSDRPLEIGEYAFAETELSNITIPDRVTIIGPYAFAGNGNLAIIGFEAGSNCETVGEGAFESVAGVPLAVSSVAFGRLAGYDRYVELDRLYSVELADSVRVLGAYAFRNSTNILEILLNDGLLDIEQGAFLGCSKLVAINIPESVRLIGEEAFGGCTALQSVNIKSDMPYTLGGYAFRGCVSLTSLSLKMVSMVGDAPIYGCNNLELLYVDTDNPYYKTVGSVLYTKNVTYTVNGQPKTYQEDELLVVYPAGKKGSAYGITRNTKEIGERAFSGNRYLTSLSIDAKETAVVTIHNNSFENTSDRLEFFVASAVVFLYEQNVVWRAYSSRIKNSAISVENFIIELLPGDSQSCRIIKYIGLVEAGDNISVPSTLKGLKVKEIGQEAFSHNATIRTISIPQGITAIAERAFYNCVSLETVNLPDSVQEIGEYAFYGCSALKNVEFGQNSLLTAIPNYAFQYCTSLVSFTLPRRVASIGLFAFAGSDSRVMALKSVTFPPNSSLTSIGSNAFQYCRELTSISLPASLTILGINLFKKCTSLTSVILSRGGSDITQLQNESVFDGTPSELMIYVPAQSRQEYTKARYWKSFAQRIEAKESIREGYSVEDMTYDYAGIRITEYLGILNPITSIYDKSYQSQLSIPESISGVPVVTLNTQDGTFSHRLNNTLAEMPYTSVRTVSAAQILILTDSSGRQHSVMAERLALSINGWRILKYLGDQTEVTIPGIIQQKRVLEIGEYSFNSRMLGVELSEGILAVAANAFRYCSLLSSIRLPLTLTKIGAYAFYDTDIDEVSIGTDSLSLEYSRLVEIGDYAFYNCTAIARLALPPQLDKIGNYAFSSAGRMTLNDVTFLGQTMSSIGKFAFANTSLTDITLPKKLSIIGDGAFSGCTGLSAVYLNEDSRDSTIVNLESGAQRVFENCNYVKIYVDSYKLSYYRDGASSWNRYISRLFSAQSVYDGFSISIIDNDIKTAELVHYNGEETDVIIPETINGYRILTIAQYAFNDSVRSVTVPRTVTGINSYAFYKSGLETIYFAEGSSLTAIGQYAFSGSELRSITIPMSVMSIGDYAFTGAKLESIAFDGSDILEADDEPVAGLVIGGYVFSENLALTTVSLPKRTLSVGQYAFNNDKNLSSITLPEGGYLTTIYSYAFAGCSSLASVTVPFTVTEMQISIFDSCTSLEALYIMRGRDGEHTDVENLTVVGAGLLNNINNPFIKIFVPRNSVAEYKNMANWRTFAGCSDSGVFDPLTYPDYIVPNLIYEDYAYSVIDASSIELTQYRGTATDITIPGNITIGPTTYNVKSIGRMFGNNRLRSVTMLPGYRQSINIFAFSNCAALEHVQLSSTVETINAFAFYNCPSLRSVELPEGIAALPASAFAKCSSLRELNLPSTVLSIGAMAFADCTSLYRLILNTNGIIEGGSNMLMNSSQFLKIFASDELLQNYRAKTLWSEFSAKIISKEFIYGSFAVEQLYTGGIRILQYCGFLNELTIPASIKGRNVESIAPNAVITEVQRIYIDSNAQIAYEQDIAPKIYRRAAYTVVFDGNGGERAGGGGAEKQLIIEGGAAIAPIYKKEGYDFDGWDLDFDNITEDITVTAQWMPRSVTISFESNGGTPVDSITAPYGSPISPPPDPSFDDHSFDGWYTDNGSFLQLFVFDEMPPEDITLYAKWEA